MKTIITLIIFFIVGVALIVYVIPETLSRILNMFGRTHQDSIFFIAITMLSITVFFCIAQLFVNKIKKP